MYYTFLMNIYDSHFDEFQLYAAVTALVQSTKAKGSCPLVTKNLKVGSCVSTCAQKMMFQIFWYHYILHNACSDMGFNR